MARWFLILVLFTSCVSRHQIKELTNETSNTLDSVRIIERVIVDTIRIPAEEIISVIPITVFKHDTVIFYKQGRAQTRIVYKSGKLHLNTRCDSLERLILSTQKELIHISRQNESKKQISESNKERENSALKRTIFWIIFFALTAFFLRYCLKKVLSLELFSSFGKRK